MIKYNNRYRGQFEYDKFVINILSLHNMVKALENFEITDVNEELKNLLYVKKEIDTIYNILTGNNGVSEEAYKLMLSKRGACL